MKIQMLNHQHQQINQQHSLTLNYLTKNNTNLPTIQYKQQKQYFPERLTRIQLNKINLNELRQMAENLTKKVEKANSELMALLEARDTLSMKRDALAVEVQDLKEREEEKGRRGHQ